MKLFLIFLIISGFDEDFSKYVTNSFPESTAKPLFSLLSCTADIEVLAPTMVFYSIVGGDEAFHNTETIALAGTLTGTLVFGLKYITNRRRPRGEYTRLNSSFPSGHAATAFLIADYMGKKYPGFRPLLYSWAIGVGLSRIYLYRHWPSDVIFGGIIGIFASRISLRFEDEIHLLFF